MKDAKEGKRPQFVNKCEYYKLKFDIFNKSIFSNHFKIKLKAEKKLMELAEKYKELKKSGKIEKFLAKKRKKQLGKDNKHLNKNEHVRYV